MHDAVPNTIIWFKRDLRIRDHAPLARACRECVPTLMLYIAEPSWMQAPDFDEIHFQFIRESLDALRVSLAARNATLVIRTGEVTEVLTCLRKELDFSRIWSHQETGNAISYQRDRRVAAWCRHHGVSWDEFPQFGVVRALRDRNGWAARWNKLMARDPEPVPEGRWSDLGAGLDAGTLPDPVKLGISSQKGRQVDLHGGEPQAWETLHSFLHERGIRYHREMSSPNTAYRSCSRLSPYLAWGCISMRSVYREAAGIRDGRNPSPILKSALKAFIGRLHWHCHFIQKMETEPEIETHAFNRALDDLRGVTCDNLEQARDQPDAETRRRFLAWSLGLTGYPFVDACMRALRSTGWINFRMRAMLVSFAAYDLWLDWRCFKDFLARQFLDYEPGIHHSQVQMQSGTTGINTLRIYSPVKQGQDHDPEGLFIRRWVPELAGLPSWALHEPWKCDPPTLEAADVRLVLCDSAEVLEAGLDAGAYPLPVVDHREAVREARRHFGERRRRPDLKGESERVYLKHGSRKGPSGSREEQAHRKRRLAGQDAESFSRPTKKPGHPGGSQTEFNL